MNAQTLPQASGPARKPSPLSAYYPLLCMEDPQSAAAWFRTHFGFADTFAVSWFVQMQRADAPHAQLAVIARRHESVPKAWQKAPGGVVISFEVEDVDAEWARIRAAGLSVIVPIKTEEFPHRHFMVEGPEGALIDVIKVLQPTPEWLKKEGLV